MAKQDFREAIAEYIRQHAQPADKFSHQPRLYQLARTLAKGEPHDDDVLYAAAWMHDLGVFLGHRPKEAAALASWDHVAYVVEVGPAALRGLGFPEAKIPAVIEAMRTHLPSREPTTREGVLLRDADLLEQLGAVGIIRTLSKVGRDTRFPTHEAAVQALRRSAADLPGRLRLPMARRMAKERLALMHRFFKAAESEGMTIEPDS